MKRILLVTPDPKPDKKAKYGGGHGGYVRMSNVLLKTFSSDEFELVPCYHTVRRGSKLGLLNLPFRLIKDSWKVGSMARNADGVHLVLQYRLATAREFAVAGVANRLGCPLLVDIRAGAFKSWYESATGIERRMTRYILRSAREISVEGIDYIEFMRSEFGREATFFPNFVPSYEVPDHVSPKCRDEELSVLFVGFAYDGKGIFELVEGCERAAARGTKVRLAIAGKESDDAAEWFSSRPDVPGFSLERLGPQSHDDVIRHYESADIFCLPTRHPGEGHSNSLNEAMMMGMVIVTTRHGFIPSVIDDSACYFVEIKSPEAIEQVLVDIDHDRESARAKAATSREILKSRYSSDVVIPILEDIYQRLTTPN